MQGIFKTHIVKIGNSQGVRIPKIFLEQTSLSKEVELVLDDSQIVIRSVSSPRDGWAEQFRTMAEYGDDELLDDDLITQSAWDEEEWAW